jgi:hypothetical protein
MERFSSTSHRVFSVRGIFTFVIVVMIAALLSVLAGSQATHAADPTAAWSGESIVFDGHGYALTKDFKDPTGTIPSDAQVYKTPVITEPNGDKKVLVLYFSSGTDPPTATSVKYVSFDSDSTTLSNARDQKDVTLTVKGEQDEASSCSVSGVGWIVCPVSVFLAEAMDNVFNILADMIKVQPSILGDPDSGMYQAWNIMRNIANLAFVIVFLIIIYSQLTSLGVSNYGLKKLIPRLIIAAILVNVSFVVTALAIDISNILGYSIQNVFNIIRENVFQLTNDNFGGVNASVENPWGTLTTIILGGGGLIGGTYFLATGGIYLLLPLLLGLILTLILVVIVLAARQAIIVILVIIAPIAFVANLLPNTERWFDKWKDLFMTMLIFFPAFSLVFGGSQLAGQLIIMNAGDKIIMVLFGMAVQIAPLVITPLILKFSGSLLGRIAQIANNPNKGILDRSKNWARDRGEYVKQRNIAGQGSKLNPNSWGAGMVRSNEFRKKNLENRTKAMKQIGDNRYHASEKYGKIHEFAEGAEMEGETIKNNNARHIERLKVTPGSSLYDRAIKSQASKENLEASTNRTTQYYNGRRVVNDNNPLNASFNNLEASKATLETTENDKNTYLNRQRMLGGTVLNSTVKPLEASKLQMESTQNQYATSIEKMKVQPTSGLYNLSQGVQSSKELLEASQSDVQAMFDAQRRRTGTGLNVSTVQLETSKAAADTSKSLTTAFVNDLKADDATQLHVNVVRSEQAKLASQISETNLARTVEEYKTGEITRTGELGSLTDMMVRDVSQLAAQTQGTQAAKNIQARNVSEAFTAQNDNGSRTTEAQSLLDIAASVDQYGAVRAESNAYSTLEKIVTEARGSNMKLIENRALKQGMTVKNYAVNELLEKRLDGDMSESEDLINAALEIAGQEAQIPTLRRIRRSKNFNQGDVSAMLNRQQNVMKSKGGFDLQADFGLADATDEQMNASIAGMLGSVAAKDFQGLKFVAINDYASNIGDIIKNTQDISKATGNNPEQIKDRKFGVNGLQGLEKTYFNLSIALSDPDLIRELGDNLGPAIDIHKSLHGEFQDPNVSIPYDSIDPRVIHRGDDGEGNNINPDLLKPDVL